MATTDGERREGGRARKIHAPPVLLAALLLAGGPAGGEPAAAEEKPIARRVLSEVPLGEVPFAKPVLRAVELVLRPGGETPVHSHEGPGLRYVLEGAITIAWKDGERTTRRGRSPRATTGRFRCACSSSSSRPRSERPHLPSSGPPRAGVSGADAEGGGRACHASREGRPSRASRPL